MRTIFTGPAGESVWVPAAANVAYPGVIAGNASALVTGLTPAIAGGLNVPTQTAAAVAQQIVTFLGSLRPDASQVGTEMRMISPGSTALTAADVRDISPIKASFNNTFELGYKGILGNKFRIAIDAWREKRGDVGNPAGLATPNIFFNRTSLQTYMTTALIPAITGALMQPPFSMSQQQASATANAFAPQIAGTVAGNFAPLPLGVVSFNSETFASARDIYATYTSYDTTVTVNGVDIALDFVANANWTFSGTMSWVDNDSFPEVVSSNQRALMLNAPSNKFSASSRFRSNSGAWGFDARLRHTNAYPVNSGVYATGVDFPIPGATGTYRYDDIEAATIVDLGFNWRFQPARNEVLFSIRADNVFDEKYRTMPGAPELGMMLVTRLQYSF
jgi:iron complex outermembrane receptor protein